MTLLLGIALRIAKMLAQAASVVVIVFFLTRVVPGDVVDLLSVQGDLTATQQDTMRRDLGLDRPVTAQFVDWASGALKGDFGRSLRFNRPVADMLLRRCRRRSLSRC